MCEKNKRIKKALEIIHDNAGCDGGHHKQWALDQTLRALTGCPMIEKTSTDYKGVEYTYMTQGESEEYLEWVRDYQDGEDGPHTYEWETGIP